MHSALIHAADGVVAACKGAFHGTLKKQASADHEATSFKNLFSICSCVSNYWHASL